MVEQVSRNAQLSKSDFVLDIHFVDSLEDDQMKGRGGEGPSSSWRLGQWEPCSFVDRLDFRK